MSLLHFNKLKQTLIYALGILCCLALTTAMLAQRPRGGGFPFEGPGSGFGGMFLDQLELTDAQKTQIQTIREETRLKIQPLQEQLRKIQTDLQTAVEQGQPEEALLAFGTEQGEVMGQVAGIQAVTQSRIYNLLTAEQKAQLAKAREEMKQHREQRQSRSLQGNRPMREQ